jgi:hypothetical protein
MNRNLILAVVLAWTTQRFVALAAWLLMIEAESSLTEAAA